MPGNEINVDPQVYEQLARIRDVPRGGAYLAFNREATAAVPVPSFGSPAWTEANYLNVKYGDRSGEIVGSAKLLAEKVKLLAEIAGRVSAALDSVERDVTKDAASLAAGLDDLSALMSGIPAPPMIPDLPK